MIEILQSTVGVFYNEPKLCPNASWNSNATTFATYSYGFPLPLMIDRLNTLVAASRDNKRIFIWFNGSSNVSTMINTINRSPISLFSINDEEIFVGYSDTPYPYIDRWNIKNGTLVSSTPIVGQCYFIFVDINDDLYCSAYNLNMVMRKSSRDQSNLMTVVAGTGSAGSTAAMLSSPRGIFVTSNLDLYVADCNNDRVQLFRSGQINATTIVGSGSNSTMTVDCPSGITFDADGNLFIVSYYQYRVITVGPGGNDRCVVGCTGSGGSAANQLWNPTTLSFDIEGNLFVGDWGNNRIQKFQLIDRNRCSKSRMENDRENENKFFSVENIFDEFFSFV